MRRAGRSASSPEVAQPATGASTRAKSTDWRADALRVLEALAHCGMPFHVDDFLALAGYPPRPQMLGAAFAAAAQRNLIHVVGAAIAEGRLVRVWRGVQS